LVRRVVHQRGDRLAIGEGLLQGAGRLVGEVHARELLARLVQAQLDDRVDGDRIALARGIIVRRDDDLVTLAQCGLDVASHLRGVLDRIEAPGEVVEVPGGGLEPPLLVLLRVRRVDYLVRLLELIEVTTRVGDDVLLAVVRARHASQRCRAVARRGRLLHQDPDGHPVLLSIDDSYISTSLPERGVEWQSIGHRPCPRRQYSSPIITNPPPSSSTVCSPPEPTASISW